MNAQMKFSRRSLIGAVVLGITAITASIASADEMKFKLTGDMEVPPVSTMATGSAAITVSPDMAVSGMVMTTGLAGTMAHIHRGAVGMNGPVLITLDKSGDNGWAVPPGAKFTDEQYRLLKAGELYINVHSADHKGGEIRGQMK
jgi:hypothetical protein